MKEKQTYQELPGAELVGFGFNIFGKYDQSSKTFPVLDKGAPIEYNYDGTIFKSYENLSVTALKQTDSMVETYSSKSEIEKSLAIEAGIKVGTDTFLAGSFQTEINTRYDHISNAEEESYYILSKTNKKLWSVSGGKPNILSYPEIQNLPEKFDPENPEPFFRVLQKFGAFYIKEVHVGAALYYYESISQSHSFDKTSASANAKFEYESIFTKVTASASADWSKISEDWKKYRRSYSRTIGGIDNGGLVVSDPSGTIEQVNHNEAFQAWINSVNQGNGVPISFSLAPLYELLADNSRAQALQQATSAFLNNKFSIKADNKNPYILVNGRSLTPQNSFPTWTDTDNPSVWIVVIERQRKSIEMNLLFRLMNGTQRVFPMTPEQLDQQDYQQRIYMALKKYQGNKDYIILLTTYNLGTYATSQVSEPTNLEFSNFLSVCGAGSAFEKWKKMYMSSYPLPGGYVLTGIIGNGPNQGMDRLSFPLCIQSGALIPSLNNEKVAYSPIVTSFEEDHVYNETKVSAIHKLQDVEPAPDKERFVIELYARQKDHSQIYFNGKQLTPQNGFPINPGIEVYNGVWIVIVEFETGNLVFNVLFDEPDLERIYNALSGYLNDDKKYAIGLVSTSGNVSEVYFCPYNTKLADLLLKCGASEEMLVQWHNDESTHSSSIYSGCNYVMAGIIGQGPNQDHENYIGVKLLPVEPEEAVVRFSNL